MEKCIFFSFLIKPMLLRDVELGMVLAWGGVCRSHLHNVEAMRPHPNPSLPSFNEKDRIYLQHFVDHE